ncbi:glutathione S-transferase family protein [Calothrix sp. PCC 6303]|uniref:glutathione S-transferase family protein n=1 Tax=Calothrix sp. PCC 6303 TaxID=1170562 RepID=UPI0002A03276|nr:glutathione S-transferase family protein [Calothrix sp. PCC 6303]AFY99522.1 Glutathione S-transferase domain protein [Calothrix sp. PCC 6303]
MLKFYYNPISPMARRVWIALLEKGIPFEGILLNLDGDQLQPEYLEINPFHHIPVLEDEGFRFIESLAILDYLEAKYPTPAMLPNQANALAKVRMVQMVTSNELFSKMISLIYEREDSSQAVKAKQHIDKVLKFFTDILGENSYFGGKQISLGDIVAGDTLVLLPHLGIDITFYPTLAKLCDRLMEREVWRKTARSTQEVEQLKRRLKVLVKMRMREMSRGTGAN